MPGHDALLTFFVGVLAGALAVLAVLAFVAWLKACQAPLAEAPETAPASAGQLTLIAFGADGQHSITHRSGLTHQPILTRPHGRQPATVYALVDVHDRVGVYQEQTR